MNIAIEVIEKNYLRKVIYNVSVLILVLLRN